MKISVAMLAAVVGWAVAGSGANTPRLDTVAAIRGLSHEAAARRLPVAFEATVTFFRGYEKTLFVQDGDKGIYVGATTGLELAPGDRVQVRGTTEDSFHPIVNSSDVTLLGHGALPKAVTATWAQLITAQLDCRLARVRGTVALAETSLSSGRNMAHLILRIDGGTADIIIDNDDPSRIRELLDAEVEVTAVAGEIFDGKMQQTGVRLHVPSWAQVNLIRRAPADPWSMPATSLDDVLQGFNFSDRTPRVRVEGTLTFYHPMSMAVIQEGDKTIRLRTSQIDRLRVGNRVEAIGTPYVDNGFLSLKMASIRTLGTAAPMTPRPVTWDQLTSGKFAFNLVSTQGTVVTQVREHAQDVYIIAAEEHLFSAAVRHPFVYEWGGKRDPPPMPEIRTGSRVRVTGVAILDDGNPFNGAVAFGILMRSADDVAVLAQPSWLNVRNLMGMVIALLLVVLVVGAWGAMMRRKVHRQTVELSRRIEAEAALERRRSSILEDINGNRPLTEVLEQIAELVSFHVDGAHCWIRIGNSEPAGKCPQTTGNMRLLRQEIRSRTGPLQGTLFVALAPGAAASTNVSEALAMGAGLAMLAIETRGLYSDLVHRSEFDLLTDVHNRFSLEKHLDWLIDDPRREHGRFGLIYIDLDEFKPVNDRYGHHIGDLYLQQAADRMKRQLRPGDVLARLGGDEFAALVSQVRSRADVEEIATRLDRCFDEPFSLEGYPLRGSASMGIAMFPENGQTRDALLNMADSAMYNAKHRKCQMNAVASTGSME